MEIFEVNVKYSPSDFVSAALVYRKAVGDTKTFIIIVWVIVAFVFVSYLLPPLLAILLCLPFRTCSADTWQGFARVGAIIIGGCVILLLVAYSNILYRLRMEYAYRLGFLKFKKEYEESKKFIVNDEGLELQESSYKTTFYWKAFQQIIESQNAFLLPRKKNQYIVIPKRAFNNPDDAIKFSELIATYTNQQIKKV
jgi:hypothetical protein